jgi:PKD repeat protein
MNAPTSIWRQNWTLLAITLLISVSCEKKPSLGDPPTAEDAEFTFMPSASNQNISEFTANNATLQASWDFGNGATSGGTSASSPYPFAGTYTVTLTVQNSGGSASSSQDVVIVQDDPSLVSSPIYNLLTGGSSKTWAVDSASIGHMGVGPNPSSASSGDYPEYWAAGVNDKSGAGIYNDRYTFHLQDYSFDHVTNGDIYVNAASAGNAPFTDTASCLVGDFTASTPNAMGETWTLNEGADTSITLSGNAMVGFWTGVQTYKIVSIDSNEIFLRYEDSQDASLAWYIRLVPVGFVSDPGPPATTYALPIDFEAIQPTFATFGNSTFGIVSNPDATGANTSANVLETVHGNETWAGLLVDLNAKLDFGTEKTIKLMVWAPDTGTFRLKLEDQTAPSQFVEMDQSVTVAQAWTELTFDLTGTGTLYDRLVVFPGWNVSNAGTFYVDNIKQE